MHFERFTIDDEMLLDKQISQAERELLRSLEEVDGAMQLQRGVELANLLIVARREGEALDTLSNIEPLARSGPPEGLGWWLLYFGTAKQYLEEKSTAQSCFSQALEISEAHGLTALSSYVHHHMGRCYVETGELEPARTSFQKALDLRRALDDPRQASTRRALEALQAKDH